MKVYKGPLLGITSRSSGINSFLHSISVRLDKNNYLLWKQQIVTVVYGYGLEKHLTEEQVPPMTLKKRQQRYSIMNLLTRGDKINS